jgi:hypothetical protein
VAIKSKLVCLPFQIYPTLGILHQIGTTARQIYRVAFIIDYNICPQRQFYPKVTIELELSTYRQNGLYISIEFLLITGLISNSSTQKIDINRQNKISFDLFWPYSNIENDNPPATNKVLTNKTAFVVIFILIERLKN